ncbi:glycerol-3-phosphate dehydrogenase [NAD(+)], cytoplasmic-like isoform X2 [Lineus longissimus]|uniref:glycerol-3-phosphate dehydrogenase [NAD(+)], cytoplasmic-like isoform X2 n=1 Tax=Lineus longissimus TaxID=88925 RepID=UPI00315D88EF
MHFCRNTHLARIVFATISQKRVQSLRNAFGNRFLATDIMSKKRVGVIGSGNWGSAIAKIIGNNVKKDKAFDNQVKMWVFEEQFEGKNLTDIINLEHENKKYLPGHILPDNVYAESDLVKVTESADILVFVLPHQFIRRICATMKGHVKNKVIGVSLIKGLDVCGTGLKLISEVINDTLELKAPCNVLMGANLAPEVASENYCEATIGCQILEEGAILKRLVQTSYFRIVVVTDVKTVELCGALKNVVAVGAGIADGLGFGDNTKAAVIRLGLMEMITFIENFYPGSSRDTFFESCGIADLVTTCYGGRNRRVAEAMVKNPDKSIVDLEQEMLNGQSLQGPPTAAEIYEALSKQGLEDRYPLFTAIHKICSRELPCDQFIECLKNHPEHIDVELDQIERRLFGWQRQSTICHDWQEPHHHHPSPLDSVPEKKTD